MGSKRAAGAHKTNPYNSYPAVSYNQRSNTSQVTPASSSEPGRAAPGASRLQTTSMSILERMRAEAARTLASSQASSSSVPATRATLVTPQPQPQAAPPTQHLPTGYVAAYPQTYTYAPDARSIADFMLTVTKILESQPAKMADYFNAQFAGLRTEINSVKNSCDEVKDEVAKVKEDVKSVIEAHKTGHSATSKALKAFAQKAEALEVFLGESKIGKKGDTTRTLMGRLDEIYLAFGDMIEKLSDPDADGADEIPAHSGLELDVSASPLRSAIASRVVTPRTPTPARFLASTNRMGTRTPRPHLTRTKSPSLATQGPTPSNSSTDVEMGDQDNELQAGTSTLLQVLETSESFFTSSPKPRSNPESNGLNLECSVSPIQQKSSDALHGFSRVDWGEVENQSPSAPSTPPRPPPPISPSCLGPSGAPLSPRASLNTGPGKTSHRPSPLINVESCRDEPQEVQQLPSPLDLLPLPRQRTQSRAPSQVGSRAPSEAPARAPVQISSPQPPPQSSSQVPYQTSEQPLSRVSVVSPSKTPSQAKLPIEFESGRRESHHSPSFSRTIYDVPSSLHSADAAKIAAQYKSAGGLVEEVRNAEASPAMSVLPELGYPTRESSVVAEKGGNGEMDVDEVDLEKGKEAKEGEQEEDEREEGVGSSSEEVARVESLMDVDGNMTEGSKELQMSNALEEEMGVVREGEADMLGKMNIQAEEEARVEVQQVFVSSQFEKGEEEEEEDDEVEVADPLIPTGRKGEEQEEVKGENATLDTSDKKPAAAVEDHLTGQDRQPEKDVAERGHDEQVNIAEDKPTLMVKTRTPLFLPESRDISGIATPALALTGKTTMQGEQLQAKEEEKEEQLALQNLLPSPEPSAHVRSTSPVPTNAPPRNLVSPVQSQAATHLRFSPPGTPEPLSQSTPTQLLEEDPELELEYASCAPSPTPTSPVRRPTPVIDVSQLIPSQISQATPESTAQPPTPQSLDQSDISTPKTTRTGPHITSSSEAVHIIAQLTTLSEPESSEDEDEDEDEEGDDADDEEEVDELTPSEPDDFQEGLGEESVQETLTTASDQNIVAESSIRTFTSLNQEKDLIMSFETVEPVVGVGLIDEVQNEVEEEQEQVQVRVDVEQPLPEAEDDHMEQEDDLMQSTSVVSPVKTRGRLNPVTPIALPDYVSPVNTPSPTRSPLLSRILGVGRGGLSRKRMLEGTDAADATEQLRSRSKSQTQSPCIEVLSRGGRKVKSPRRVRVKVMETLTQAPQTQTQAQPESPLGDHIRPTNTLKATTLSSTAYRELWKDVLPASRGVSESDVSKGGREGGSQKRAKTESKAAEREGSPIYISSTPSTPALDRTKELPKIDDIDCIDLIDSFSPVKIQAREKEKEKGTKKNDVGSSSTQAPAATGCPGGTLKPKKLRTREEKYLQNQKEAEAKVKRDEERKRKRAADRKLMPNGVGAEDSDEPDVRPAKGLKLPGVDNVTETLPQNRTTQPTIPTVDLAAIQARRARNENASKARTRVKRRSKQNVFSNALQALLEKDSDDDRPSKKARTQPGGAASTASGGSSSRRKSVKEEKPPSSSSVGKGKANENGTRRVRHSQIVDLTSDLPSSPIRVKWPVKRDGRTHDKNFISCDSCHAWYHNGCVGIQIGDVRLKETEIFACPPCLAGRLQESGKSPSGTCGRPDCAFKKISDAQEEYFVKRIIGRKARVEGGKGRVEEYLVEWDGYPIGEATWEKDSFMTDPSRLVEAFIEAAEREGLDPDSEPYTTILLRDAKRCGWREEEE